jgi:membrane-associated protein
MRQPLLLQHFQTTMISSAILSWLGSDQGLMNLLASNWLWGLLIVAGIIFLETGLVILPFLPGDSLLFATGAFLGMNGIQPLWAVLLVTTAAILGDGVNYMIGHSAIGQSLIRRGWVKPHHLARTHEYFDRYGPITVTMGRFVPVVRTIAPFLAGLTGMCPRQFAAYNALGAVVWASALLMAGFWLGGIVWVREHVGMLSMGIVAASVIPVLFHLAASAQPKGV